MAGKYECRPRAVSDYPGHISAEQQGFTRVYEDKIALLDGKGWRLEGEIVWGLGLRGRA